MAEAVILDTSAILPLTGNDPGADEVQTYLAEAIAGRTQLHGSFVSLTEVEYITMQEEGAEAARQRLAELNAMPVQWFHSDAALFGLILGMNLRSTWRGGLNVAEVTERAPKGMLTADWKHLAMLNFEIEPRVLLPFVPPATELDWWNGKLLVSMVGFLFLHTRVFGIPIPFHRNFEEVNLRFYVRYKAEAGWRRGVVFIKEIVPRAAIALTARKLYNEPYIALSMSHRIEADASLVRSAEYSWESAGRTNRLKLTTCGEPRPLGEGTEAEFITEHYWGYNAQKEGSTLEYRVEHPRWRYYEVSDARLDCDVGGLYGQQFVDSLNRKPSSAFLAEGSAVTVYQGRRLAR